MRKNPKITVQAGVLVVALLAAGIASASVYGPATQSDPAGSTPVTDFERIDANGDGTITLREFQNVRVGNPWLRSFEAYDTNHDGKLTLQEFTVAEELHLPPLKQVAAR